MQDTNPRKRDKPLTADYLQTLKVGDSFSFNKNGKITFIQGGGDTIPVEKTRPIENDQPIQNESEKDIDDTNRNRKLKSMDTYGQKKPKVMHDQAFVARVSMDIMSGFGCIETTVVIGRVD